MAMKMPLGNQNRAYALSVMKQSVAQCSNDYFLAFLMCYDIRKSLMENLK